MMKYRFFHGIVLIGVGIYFFTPQLHFDILQKFQNWQSLLILIGIAFLVQAYVGKDYDSILPGTIILGFGIYFYPGKIFSMLPHGFSSMCFIIAIGLFLQHQKTKSGLMQGFILFVIGFLFYFYHQFTNWIIELETSSTHLWSYWPALLILVGCYFLLKKK